jgi:hypothetical protein
MAVAYVIVEVVNLSVYAIASDADVHLDCESYAEEIITFI